MVWLFGLIALTVAVIVAAIIAFWFVLQKYKQIQLVEIENRIVPINDTKCPTSLTKLQIPNTIFQNHKRRVLPPNLVANIHTLQSHAPNFNYIFYYDF